MSTGKLVMVQWVPLDLPHFHLLEVEPNASEYRQVVEAITRRTQPGEPIYSVYRDVAFYFMAERPPGVRDIYAPPPMTVNDGAAIVDGLKQSQVRLIVVANYFFGPRSPVEAERPFELAAWTDPIRDYLASDFRQVESFKDWGVWEHR